MKDMMTLPQPGPPPARKTRVLGDGENRIPQVAVFATDAVQVVAEVTILRKGLRVVGERAVFTADGKIEPRCRGKGSEFQRRNQLKGRIAQWPQKFRPQAEIKSRAEASKNMSNIPNAIATLVPALLVRRFIFTVAR